MNILIGDDHAVVRLGLIQLLEDEFSFAKISEASNGFEVVEKSKNGHWDLILLDISMPGRDGLEVVKQLRLDGIKAPILVLSIFPEDQFALRVLKAGASGFLNKDSAPDELVAAAQKVLKGRKYISATLAEKFAESAGNKYKKAGHESLSDREMQILRLIAVGKSVSEIAIEISLGKSTISTYRLRLLEKLGLHNNNEITRFAIDNKLI